MWHDAGWSQGLGASPLLAWHFDCVWANHCRFKLIIADQFAPVLTQSLQIPADHSGWNSMCLKGIFADSSWWLWMLILSVQFKPWWRILCGRAMPQAPCLCLEMVACFLAHFTRTGWDILSVAGLPGNFSSHSYCIGAATVAAHSRVPDHLIQALGWWSRNACQ